MTHFYVSDDGEIAEMFGTNGDITRDFEKTARAMKSLAVEMAPLGSTGLLKKSHHYRTRRDGPFGRVIELYNTADHAYFVHEGHGTIYPTKAQALVLSGSPNRMKVKSGVPRPFWIPPAYRKYGSLVGGFIATTTKNPRHHGHWVFAHEWVGPQRGNPWMARAMETTIRRLY